MEIKDSELNGGTFNFNGCTDKDCPLKGELIRLSKSNDQLKKVLVFFMAHIDEIMEQKGELIKAHHHKNETLDKVMDRFIEMSKKK